MTDPIRAALERLIARIEETHNPNDPVPAWFDSYFAARAALAEPLPPKVGHIQRLADIIEECQPKTPYVIATTALAQAILSHPDIGLVLANSEGPAVPESREQAFVAGEPSDEEFRQLYCDIFDLRCDPASLGPVPVKFARAVLARWGNQPAPPAEGEVGELVAKLRRLAPHNPLGTADPTITRAAELLQQQHPTPVPVSERLPGDQLCWWYEPDEGDGYGGGWTLLRIRGGTGTYSHWLPAHALPLPQGEVEP